MMEATPLLADDEAPQEHKAADADTFFTAIAPALYKAEGEAALLSKVKTLVSELSDEARMRLWETPLENTLFEKIKNEVIRDWFLANNPRDKEYIYCPTCAEKLVTRHIDNRELRACPKCSFVFWNNPKPVASIIIPQDGKVLMVQRAQTPLLGYWCLPGGYISYGEEPSAAAVREAKEETNLEVEADRLVGVYTIDNDPRGHNIDIIFSGHIISGSLAPNDEVIRCRYFALDELPEQIAYKHRNAIADWSVNVLNY